MLLALRRRVYHSRRDRRGCAEQNLYRVYRKWTLPASFYYYYRGPGYKIRTTEQSYKTGATVGNETGAVRGLHLPCRAGGRRRQVCACWTVRETAAVKDSCYKWDAARKTRIEFSAPTKKLKEPIMVSTAGQAIDKSVYFFVHVYINKQGTFSCTAVVSNADETLFLGPAFSFNSPHLSSRPAGQGWFSSGYIPLLGDHSLQSLTLLSCSRPAMFRSVLDRESLAFLLSSTTPTPSIQGPIAEVAARCCCSFDSDHNAS